MHTRIIIFVIEAYMLIQTIETNSSSKLHIDPAENLSSYFLVLKNVTDKRSSTKSYMSGLFF